MTQTKLKTKEFNANDHLLILKHNQKQPGGTYKEVQTEYLPVAWRIVWFRDKHPDYMITTEIVENKDDHAIVKATIYTHTDRIWSTAHKREDKVGWADYLEKAETGAIGRALAMCGFGTQFSPDIEEGTERIVDSPIELKTPVQVAQEPKEPLKVAGEGAKKAYFAVAKKAGYEAEKAKEMAKKQFKLEGFNDITIEQVSAMITAMGKKVEDKESEQVANDAIGAGL